MYKETTSDITIEVDANYVAEQSRPEQNYFFYAYTVQVTNGTSKPVQLLNRHWIITDGQGQVEHVEGEGVVGEQPIINPGETYSYSSACPLSTKTGNMRGYYGMSSAGNSFRVSVPLFFLRHPETFH
jgi:ApaG protein